MNIYDEPEFSEGASYVVMCYNLYGNDWLKHDNTINEDALTDFFIKVNEMYIGYMILKASSPKINNFDMQEINGMIII